MSPDPTCVFRCDRGLVAALEAALGPPIDSYLNGWQVWVEPAAFPSRPEPVEVEYRLHPPPGFRQPRGMSHHDLWDAVVTQLAEDAGRLRLGEEERALEEVWELLEAYPAFGDDVEPGELAAVVEAVLGRPALAAGVVDHDRLGAEWRRRRGEFDLPGAVLDALGVRR